MIGGVGWYRKDFSLPEHEQGARVGGALRVGQLPLARVAQRQAVGTNRGAYIPFEFRLQGIKRRGTNRLVIRVDSKRHATDFPPSGLPPTARRPAAGGTTAGLQREVYLRGSNRVDLKSVG